MPLDGAEIISIDAFNKSSSCDEFVIGIAIMKPAEENLIERYLNIYTEGAGEGEDSNTLETIAQNCLMVELTYTPYLLYHTIIPSLDDSYNEVVWLTSGNDNKIHLIKEDKLNHSYAESQLEKYFPELKDLDAIALGIDIYYYEGYKWRLTAISCECGLIKLAKVNVQKLEVIQTWRLKYNDPINSIRIFSNKNYTRKCTNLKIGPVKETKLNIFLNTGNTAVIFTDILKRDLNFDETLSMNELTSELILCSCVADINMDGKNEVLLGTDKQEVLTFALLNETWSMIDKKLFDASVYSLSYVDLAGHGVKVLVILTQCSIHIMQHNPRETKKKWQEKFLKLTSSLYTPNYLSK